MGNRGIIVPLESGLLKDGLFKEALLGPFGPGGAVKISSA